jgi:calcineurin-like phosphoesterase family protein
MIFFTSDEHYYHHNILMHRSFGEHDGTPIEIPAMRRFRTTDEMHKVLKKRFNEVVSPDDVTYHLGDFAYGPGAKSWQQLSHIVEELNGSHHLILGNHDHLKPFDYLEAGFLSVHTSLDIEQIWYDSACDERINRITLVHDPAVAGVLQDKFFIHGNTHSLGKHLNKNTYCVSVELTDYYPVPITDISFGDVQSSS